MTTEVVTIERPDQVELMKQANAVYEVASEFVIDGPETYQLAADELVDIKARIAKLDEQRKAITKPLDAAKKAVMELFSPVIDRLSQAETSIKGSILTYQDAQERKRKEEQARLEAAARAERERAEAAARAQAEEAERLLKEAQREYARAAGAASAENAESRQKAEALRKQAEEAAASAAAAQVIAETVVAPAAVEVVDAPQGIGSRGTVEFEVESFQELVRHVAAHPELMGLLRTDDVKLRGYVRAVGTSAQIPGVRVFIKRSITARRAA